MPLPVDSCYGRYVQHLTFFCLHCQRALETCGHVNKLVCLKCRCIFLVKIELQEIKGPSVDADIRQLTSSSEVQDGPGTAGEKSLPDGADPPREGDVP